MTGALLSLYGHELLVSLVPFRWCVVRCGDTVSLIGLSDGFVESVNEASIKILLG